MVADSGFEGRAGLIAEQTAGLQTDQHLQEQAKHATDRTKARSGDRRCHEAACIAEHVGDVKAERNFQEQVKLSEEQMRGMRADP